MSDDFKFDLSDALRAVQRDARTSVSAKSLWRNIEAQLRSDSNVSRTLDRVAREVVQNERDVSRGVVVHLRALLSDVIARIVRLNVVVVASPHADSVVAKLHALSLLLPHCSSAIPYRHFVVVGVASCG